MPSSASSGTVITFRGFLAAYEEGRDDELADDEERRLPQLARGDDVKALGLEPQGHETSPPARYTEATLVKALEDRGIGRPSTYASILGTILDRGYVLKKGTALVPTFLAFAVTQLLEQHYGRLVDYDFTAQHGGRPRPDRRRRGAARRLADPLLQGDERRAGRAGLARPARDGHGASRRDRRAGGQLDRAARKRHRRPRRPVRALPGARRGAGVAARGHRPRRAHAGASRGAARRAGRRPRARRRPRDRPARAAAQRPLRPVCHRGARRRAPTEKPRTASLSPVDVAGDGDARRRRSGCSRCRAWSAESPTASRCWR